MKDNNSLYFFCATSWNFRPLFKFLGFSHFIINMVSLLQCILGSQQIKIYVQITAMKAVESISSVIPQSNRSSDQNGISSLLEGPLQALSLTPEVC